MRGRRARQGITLLEMLIALAIIGVMSSVVWPSATAALDSLRLRSAADSVASLLAQAALRVERRQQPVEIVIDPEGGRFTVSGASGNDRKELQLDEGITISSVEPSQKSELSGEDGQPAEQRVVLMPGAGWPALRVEISGARQNRRVIRLDPITGAPEVRVPEAGERQP
jgi:prepilin-type N-terminal cleavage/methylation domain-containing protein